MFESNLADRDVIALPEAANDYMIDAGPWDGLCALTETDTHALLEGATARIGRRRAQTVRFHDSGAALFRPFRVY